MHVTSVIPPMRRHRSRGEASARVVFAAPPGETLTDPENKAALLDSVAQAKQGEQVIAAVDPYSAGALSP
jgi:putative drug exporter of the RND superfamily